MVNVQTILTLFFLRRKTKACVVYTVYKKVSYIPCLHGSLSNYWTVKTSASNSWLANKLIKMRGEMFIWIKLRVGNGASCRFWIDNWSPLGSLKDYFAASSSSRQGISLDSTLADLHRSGNWVLPQDRSDAMVLVQTFLTSITLEDEVADAYEWNVTGAPTIKYKTSLVYWKLKREEQRVPWAKIVWTSRGIPKHNFLVWLFVLNRCSTRDRLLSWGLSVDANCLLWNREAESRDHLFFRCPFSWRIWSEIARRCSFTPSPIWLDVMDQLITLTGNILSKHLILLCWQAVIYSLWREWNQRLHSQRYQSADSIIFSLNRLVKDRLLSFRPSSPAFSSSLMQLWLSTE